MSDAQLSFRKSANIDRVTDKRKDSLFRLVDTDGSGTIDAQEFAVLYDAIKKDLAEELEKEAALQKEASSARRRFKMLLLFVAVLVSFLAASVAANFAVIFTVVDQAITTTTSSTGLLEVKGSDIIAKTATATQDVPLLVAPALDLDTLFATKSLKVKYTDLEAYYAEPVEAQLSIVAVRKHNTTFVEFVTDVAGEMVEILNGDVHLVRYPTGANGLEKPRAYPICSANATCSAFRASGVDVEAALDLAKLELAKAGFEDKARRLTPASGYCYGGAWTGTHHCGYEWQGPGTNPNFHWKGYCFPDSSSVGGALEGEYQANMATPKPIWYDNLDQSVPSPPPPAHPIPANNQVHFFWPPATGALVSYYWSGWGPQKHVVFFAHGKFGWWKTWWNKVCCHNCMPLSCPDLEETYFKHLVFVFGSSGIVDYGFLNSAGWSRDAGNSNSFADSASALAGITDELKIDAADTAIATFECRKYKYEVCKYKSLEKEDEKKKQQKGEDNKKKGDDAPRGSKGMEFSTVPTKKEECVWLEGTNCPFNSLTEMMVVGYSDGGGLGVYMNYFTTMVSKAVALDYWAYASYDTWLTPAGSTIDAKIYTNCASSMFDYGPAAIFDSSLHPSADTYVSGSSLDSSPAVFDAPTTTVSYNNEPFYEWTWSNVNLKKKITFAVHGLGTSSGPPSWLSSPPLSDDDDWAKWSGSTSVLGDECGTNNINAGGTGGGIHGDMFDYGPYLDDILDWVTPSYWSGSGRRLGTVFSEENFAIDKYVKMKDPKDSHLGFAGPAYSKSDPSIKGTSKYMDLVAETEPSEKEVNLLAKGVGATEDKGPYGCRLNCN